MRLLAVTCSVCLAALAMSPPSYGAEADPVPAAEPRADIPGNSSTKATLELGRTVYSSLETVGDRDWFRMELKSGVEYQIRVHGVGVNELDDPFIELFDASGNSLGTVDDRSPGESWGGPNANDPVGYVNVNVDGTFYVSVSSFVEGDTTDDTGDYIVTLVESPPDGSFFQTHDEIAWQLTTNFQEFFDYDSAIKFSLGADRSLTYNVQKLTGAGRALAEAALQSWSDITGIGFKRTTGAKAELDFDDGDAGVNAYTTPTVAGSQIISSKIMVTGGWLDQFGTSFDSYSFETYLHEVGKALGLGFAGNYSGSVDDQYYTNDSVAYSVMSLSQAANDEFTQGEDANNPNVRASFRYMQTMGVADIIAIRNLYGNTSKTRTGDTTYGFNSNTGNPALDGAAKLRADMFMMVYDDGGEDTLDFSRTNAAQRIDLRGDSFSNVLGGRMNLSIARDTIIENAIGGSGRDTIIGNGRANSLTGGDGKDTFVFTSILDDVDRIEDFAAKDDMIALSRSIFTRLPLGDLAGNAFKDIGVAGARVDASDRIIYNRKNGVLFYDPDGNGDRPAVRFATIRTKARLTAKNFTVIETPPTTPPRAAGGPAAPASVKTRGPALSDRPRGS